MDFPSLKDNNRKNTKSDDYVRCIFQKFGVLGVCFNKINFQI